MPIICDDTVQQQLQRIETQQEWLTEQLLQTVSMNSGTLNATGVDRVGKHFNALFQQRLNCQSRSIELPVYQTFNHDSEPVDIPLGKLWQLTKHPGAPLQVLLSGHLDTVFGPDDPFQSYQWIDEATLGGPGVSDMKGGILVMLAALEALETSSLAGQIGWTVILNPDEEIGSPGSAAILAAQAQQHHLGLIYEPALPNGNLAGERKGSGNFTLLAQGVAAHAGREHHLGRNAICALADFIQRVDSLNGQRQGVTINVGIVSGGRTTNQVPDRARCRFNIRTRIPEDEYWCQLQLQQIINDINQFDGIHLELHGAFGRTPKQLNEQHLTLYKLVTECSAILGTELQWESTGGCCDGNNLSAAGLPNVDTLGVLGGRIHSAQEFIQIDSLVSRAQLSSLLLFNLARHEPTLWRNSSKEVV